MITVNLLPKVIFRQREQSRAANMRYRSKHKDRLKVSRRQWLDNNVEYRRIRERGYARDNRNKKLIKRYGITIYQFEEMVAAVQGRCQICQLKRKLHVDHDHRTGRIRGLLCGHCNRGIGCFQEDPPTLRAAITYLEVQAAEDALQRLQERL